MYQPGNLVELLVRKDGGSGSGLKTPPCYPNVGFKSEVASGQTFSSRFDGGRARDDPGVWSSDAASNLALDSAAGSASNATLQPGCASCAI